MGRGLVLRHWTTGGSWSSAKALDHRALEGRGLELRHWTTEHWWDVV